MKQTVLLTHRLKLRSIKMSDLASIHALHALPETDEFNTLGIPKNSEQTRETIPPWVVENQQKEVKNYTFAIEYISGSHFIGLIALNLGSRKYKRGEVWYKIHPTFWVKDLGLKF